jgi:hypothetical protein
MRVRVFQVRQDRRGFAPIVAELLMVIMTVGMAASMYIMLGGVLSQSNVEVPTLLTLRDTGQQHSGAPGYCCLNDTFLQIIDASGKTRHWNPPLQFQIWDASGAVLFIQGDLNPVANDPYVGVYHGAPDELSVVSIGFVDLDRDGLVSVTDTFQIRGMSKEYHDASLKITTEGVMLASYTLP